MCATHVDKQLVANQLGSGLPLLKELKVSDYLLKIGGLWPPIYYKYHPKIGCTYCGVEPQPIKLDFIIYLSELRENFKIW
jgi:3'-phosphoadenosine 5'-phosphosulfate sulfotransferase (PAPS reductase)/FAD synthetase